MERMLFLFLALASALSGLAFMWMGVRRGISLNDQNPGAGDGSAILGVILLFLAIIFGLMAALFSQVG